jgi:hypothetical protein
MILNHEAIRRAYPNAVSIDDRTGAFDVNGNKIELEQAKIESVATIVVNEQAVKNAKDGRLRAYISESDPLFFKFQRGEATKEEWIAKVDEIRQRLTY